MDLGSIIQDGLPPAAKPKQVVIVGAGMAGLTAAYELLRAGHDPIIKPDSASAGAFIC